MVNEIHLLFILGEIDFLTAGTGNFILSVKTSRLIWYLNKEI